MNNPTRFIQSAALTAMLLLPPAAILLTPNGAQAAQALRYMSCNELWYERNAIYADNGYCFKTRRARRAFGRACFPPYGRLSPRERRRVNRIKEWEYDKGCR